MGASSQLTSVMLKGGLYGVDIKAANIPVSQDSVVLAPHETYTKYFDIANLDEPGCGRGCSPPIIPVSARASTNQFRCCATSEITGLLGEAFSFVSLGSQHSALFWRYT